MFNSHVGKSIIKERHAREHIQQSQFTGKQYQVKHVLFKHNLIIVHIEFDDYLCTYTFFTANIKNTHFTVLSYFF